MNFNYHRLSPRDFEALAADLMGVIAEGRFERFGEGPDGGIDFRQITTGANIIGQAKRYQKANELLSKIHAECEKIDKLKPTRYLLVVSCPLNPRQKSELVNILSPWLKNTSDIFSEPELDALLSENPQILRRHFKLWISDAAQISAVLFGDQHARSQVAQQREIQHHLRHFVRHGGWDAAKEIFFNGHVCLITGEPGIGKTALAVSIAVEMLALEPNYDLHWISDRRPAEALKLLNTSEKLLFVLDDFLGATFLTVDYQLAFFQDMNALINLARHSSGRIKVILTTRDYVLGQAIACIGEQRLGADMQFMLNEQRVSLLGFDYLTRGEILYYLLNDSSLNEEQRSILVSEGCHWDMISSPEFNPRLIEYLLNSLGKMWPKQGIKDHVNAQLNNPRDIWLHPYHDLSNVAKCLLLVVALTPNSIILDDASETFHGLYCALYGQPSPLDAVNTAIIELEPNFLYTEHCGENLALRLANGGIADLIQNELVQNSELFRLLIKCIRSFEQGMHLLRLYFEDRRLFTFNNPYLVQLIERLAEQLLSPMARLIRPVIVNGTDDDGWRIRRNEPGVLLSELWKSLMPHPDIVQLAAQRLLPHVQCIGWNELLSKGHMATLFDLVALLPEKDQICAWQVAGNLIQNSEDAAAVARLCHSNLSARNILFANPNEIIKRTRIACMREIKQSEDEYHIGAILEDIDTIEECLGFDCPQARRLANEKLEAVFAGEDHYYDGQSLTLFEDENQYRKFAELNPMIRPEVKRAINIMFDRVTCVRV